MSTALAESPARAVPDRTAGTVERLREVASSTDFGSVEWQRPDRSAAFSRRDALSPGFASAVEAMRDRGFEPFIRPVGGRLAAYHDGALVLDVLTRCDDVRAGTTARFREMSNAIAIGLASLGVDARVGEVPGEYCPGEWSVNASGRRKLVGTGQRLVRGAVLFTAVIVVGDPDPLAEAMRVAYDCLGLDFDPRTVGSVSHDVPGVTLTDVEEALDEAVGRVIGVGGPDIVGTRRIIRPWMPA